MTGFGVASLYEDFHRRLFNSIKIIFTDDSSQEFRFLLSFVFRIILRNICEIQNTLDFIPKLENGKKITVNKKFILKIVS